MLNGPTLHPILVALGLLLGSILLGILLRKLTDVVVRRLVERSATDLDNRILGVVEAKITILTVLGGLSLGLREIRKAFAPEMVTLHQVLDYLGIALFVVLVLLLFHLLSRLFKTTIVWYTETVSLRTRTNIGPTIVPLTTKLVNLLLLLIVAMIVLDHLGVNVGGLLVSLGIGSLAVALAAQETLANMIAWFVIVVDQPIRIGDLVRLSSGEEGTVHEIGLRSTRILNYDNNIVVVPNSEIVKQRLVNFAAPDREVRVLVECTVAYGTDIEGVRAIMLRLASQRRDVLPTPPPQVFVMNLGAVGVSLRLAARTSDVQNKFEIETALREQIYTSFREAGIQIPVLRYTAAHEP